MISTYELKRLNGNSRDISKALKLYSENIEPSYRTDTREILHWIDRFEKEHGDPFVILGLYLNNALIGYCQLIYFREEKFVEVDYLVIERSYRKNNAFFEFIDKIGDFLSDNNMVFDYITCEVGCYFEEMEPTESSKTLMRLLKMSHFGVIKSSYYVPRLGKQNYESQMRAVLMIYAIEELRQLQKETYLKIINTLLFKYYQRWYKDFFDSNENKEYKELLGELFSKIKKDVDSRKVIEINGYQNLLPLNPSDFNQRKIPKLIRAISFFVLFVISAFGFGVIAFIVKNKYNIEFENQVALLTLAVTTASILVSVLFNKNSNFVNRFTAKIIDKL